MRRFVTALLAAATLAGPLVAQDRPDRDWRGAGDDARDRGQRPDGGPAQPARDDTRRDERPGTPDRVATAPDRRGAPQPPQQQDRDAQRPDPQSVPGQPGRRADTGRNDAGRYDAGRYEGRQDDRGRDDRGRDDRGPGNRNYGSGGPNPGPGDPRRDDRRYENGRYDDGRYGNGPAQNRQIDPRRFGQQAGRGWDRGWREDRRYDWQGRRAAAPARFRTGRYVAPRGWNQGYRRWNVGIRLQSGFFARNYWLDNTAYWGLPPAYGPYRWVRYYDDVLLVDLGTGIVADVIPAFFY